ncbi:MAG: hypothetical protein ACQESE_00270 [Nanobdellota archaeon]
MKQARAKNRAGKTALSATMTMVMLLVIVLSLAAPFALTQNETNSSQVVVEELGEEENTTEVTDSDLNESTNNENGTADVDVANETSNETDTETTDDNQTVNDSQKNETILFGQDSEFSNSTNITNESVVDDNDTSLTPGSNEYGQYYELGSDNQMAENESITTDTDENDSIKLVSGEVITDTDITTNSSSYYIELDETAEPLELNVSVDGTEQGDVQIDVPVKFTQELSVTNVAPSEVELTINLWKLRGVDDALLNDMNSLEITSNGTLISEQSLFPLRLEANESKNLMITYTLPEVTMTMECTEKTIEDVLPEDATITEAELNISSVLTKECSVQVAHDGSAVYEDVTIPLDQVDVKDLITVIDASTGDELPIINGTIMMD